MVNLKSRLAKPGTQPIAAIIQQTLQDFSRQSFLKVSQFENRRDSSGL
jgi:hypothetical protein